MSKTDTGLSEWAIHGVATALRALSGTRANVT